ncbi:LamG-like jellyroll fold domain-containing protein [Microbispora sp. GKU 823]|uniref:LamG-like jellyroll fold domain-containing protein n=1 Tax=Microbispora sp. GKU 823 TaxID=1652100 RepID=UPI0015C40EDD|nr:LamG-like jellyroll fold domain-containing protein [Microbispora sp. GKU 823]
MTQFPKPKDPDAPLREAIAEAKKQGKPVPVPSKDTETSWTWAYPDSHLTTETWAGPARVKQSDGTFRWIDTTLEERDGALRPKVAKADVRIGDGGDTHLASLERADKGQSFAIDWPTVLPKPRVEGNKAIYDISTSGLKADLVVTALATGFRHDVVLRERPTGPVEFRLPVRTEGLKLGRTEAGGLKLTDAKGKVVASAAEPFMTEAPSTDAKSAPNTRGRIDAALVGKNGAQTLVIKPDAGFLADKDTTYPVTVDPTVSLTLARDVSVQSSSSSAGDETGSTLYVGSGTYLQAERRCSGSVCTTTNKIYPDFFRTYIDFGSDTGALAGKYVDSATLQLVGSYTGPCVGRTITASPITSSWLSVSYLRRPSTSATGTVTVTPSCSSNAVTSFNVTQMVKDWVTGSGFYGVELKSAEDSRSSWPDDPNPITAQYWSFNSTEAGQNPPKLSVNYLLPPEIPTVTGESIDSIAGNDAISRTSDVKVNYSSTSVDGKNIDYLVSISDPTTPIPVPTTSPSPDPSPTPTPSPSPSSTPFPGLVAAYGMNEGTGTAVGDQSGTGNAGTTSGTTWAAGKFGQALSFNGSSSMVTVPDSPSLRLTNKMTIEAWVKPSIATSWRSVLMKETSSSTSYGIYSNTTVGRTFVGPTSYLQIGGSVTSVSGPSALPTGAWSHIASTYDGSVIKTYLNGSVVAQSNVSGTLATSTGPLHMGGNGIWGEYYGGLIDEVRIYNGVLTQGQIQSDMNTAVGNTTTVDNPPSAPGTLNAVAGPDTVDLSWGAATDDHGTVTYQVHRSTTAGFTPTAATRVATVNGLTYSDSGMVQGQYYYRIVAVDNAGQAGAPSNEAAARTSAQLFPPVTGSPSGQVVSNEFKLGSPDSFKFKVKACLSGITPRMCNETPYYRITTDAPYVPTDTETGLADPQAPILSAMVARPSGGPVTARFYLYNSVGQPVGAVPLIERTIPGRERISVDVPEGLLQPGQTYTWQAQSCAVEVCSSKSAPVSFTIEAVDGETSPEPIQQSLTLGQSNFVFKAAKSSATACGGGPCVLQDSDKITVGGEGEDRVVSAFALNMSEVPDGAVVTSAVLDLGSAACAGAPCPADATVVLRPLKAVVTSETTGAQLAGLVTGGDYSMPIAGPQADIAGDEFSWFSVETNQATPITFGEADAQSRVSLKISYIPAGPPSSVMNLVADAGDGSATVRWGVPESNGSMSILDGYDVEVFDPSGDQLDHVETEDATVGIDGLTNDVTYTVKVRARTRFGAGEWSSVTVMPKPLPSPCDTDTYTDAVRDYYQAQDAVLDGEAPDVWDVPNVTRESPIAASLSLLNAPLVRAHQAMSDSAITRTDSQVVLKNVVVSQAADGEVQVAAEVERRWTERNTTSGETEPHESMDKVVHTFDACDDLNATLDVVDQNEDTSDFIDTGAGSDDADGDGEAYLRSLHNQSASLAGGSTTTRRSDSSASPGSPLTGKGAMQARTGVSAAETSVSTARSSCPYYSWGLTTGTPTRSYRYTKGTLFQVAHSGWWRVCDPRQDDTEWVVDKMGAVSTLYTDSWFWKPTKKDPKTKKNVLDKAAQKLNKYILANSSVDVNSAPCFRSQATTYTIEVSGAFGFPDAEVAGGISLGRTAGKDCGSTVEEPGERLGGTISKRKAALRTTLWVSSDSAVANCFQSAGNTCSVDRFRQTSAGKLHLRKGPGNVALKSIVLNSDWVWY